MKISFKYKELRHTLDCCDKQKSLLKNKPLMLIVCIL